MKTHTSKRAMVLAVSLLVFYGCSNPSPPYSPPDHGSPESNFATPVNKQPSPKPKTPLPKPLVRIIGVKLDKSTNENMRQITVEVKNDSDFDVIFSTSCAWDCPAGNVKNWFADIEQGTYLKANEQRSIGGSTPRNLGCLPLPSFLDFKCKIKWKEKNALLNEWSSQLTVPF